RRAQPFEDPVLAPQHELDREPGEGSVRTAVADEPREQRLRRRYAVDPPGVHGAEKDVEQKRKQEDEERRLPAPPEDELLRSKLGADPRRRRSPPGGAVCFRAHASPSASSASSSACSAVSGR